MFIKIQKAFFYFLIVYTIIGFFVLPPIIKPQLIHLIENKTYTKVRVQDLSFNPFLWKLHLVHLDINDVDDKPLFSVASCVVDVDPTALLYGAFRLHLLVLEDPFVNIVRNSDATVNLSHILKPQEGPQSKQQTQRKLPRIIIDKIALNGGVVAFSDYTFKKPYKFQAHDIGLRIENIDTRQKSYKKGKIRFYATLEDGGFLDVHTNIVDYKPFIINTTVAFKANKLYTAWRYVQDMLHIEVADGKLHFSGAFHFNSEDLNATTMRHANIEIDNLRLKPKGNHKDILTLKKIALEDVNASVLYKDVNISRIVIQKLNVMLKRTKSGTIDWVQYLKVATKNAASKQQLNTKEQQVFSYKINTLSLLSSNMLFEDDFLAVPAVNSVNNMQIRVSNINSQKGSLLRYTTSCQVNHKGSIKTQGTLQREPFMQKGSFTLEDVPLTEITPYLQQKSYLAITDGFIDAQGKESYSKRSNQPDVEVSGSLGLHSFFVQDTKNNKLLFSLSTLGMTSYTLELLPGRFYAQNIDINSFFVDAELDKKRVFNFAKLVKKESKQESSHKSKYKEKGFPYKIDTVNIAFGSAIFKDYSIPIKFETNIHDLNGVVYSVTNMTSEHTLVNVNGEVDKYGSTRIEGSFAAQNPKKFTDMDVNFKNLNLSAMSGYSAAFAGYKIDAGKLFLDLKYNIVDSQLQASNKIVIKKIKLGDEIEDGNTTHIPLGFIIGLLEDNNGVIDIDMPIDGNLQKPDFKYGKVVINTIKNLFTKAVTAPFAFVGSLLGIKSDDLEFVAFESGASDITPMQREKLDRLAEIMKKRDKLSLTIRGVYDKRSDRIALQKKKLIALVLQKSGRKNEVEHKNAMTVDMLEEIFKEHSKKGALQKFQDTLKQKLGAKKYVSVYRKKLIAADIAMMQVSQKELKELAKMRAKNIQDYLVFEKKIVVSRVQISPKMADGASENGFVKVTLKLNI